MKITRKARGFLRKLASVGAKGRRLVMVHDEKVTVDESVGRTTIIDRVIDWGPVIGLALIAVAVLVYFGGFKLVGLSVPDAVGHLALAFGVLLAGPWLVRQLRRRKITATMEVKAKGVPTVKKRVIRAGDEKKPKA